LKIYYEVKNKIGSTLGQLFVHVLIKQNEQQRKLKDLKTEKNNLNSLSKFYWLSS